MDRNRSLTKIAFGAFYLGIITEVLMVIIDKSAYTNPIEGRLFQFTFLLFFIKVCLTKYSKTEYLTIFLFCILGAISYFITDRNEVIRLVMLIAACKNVDMQKCLKTIFYITLIGCVLIIILSILGIYGTISNTMDYGRGGVETRYVLGMGHPNALQCMVWALTALGLYLFGEKLRLVGYLVILAVNFFFYLLSDSRTSLLVIVMTILLAYFFSINKHPLLKRILAGLCIGGTIFCIAFSVLTAANAYRVYEYEWSLNRSPLNRLWAMLNELLNGRIRILSGTLKFEGTISTWSLFSSPERTYYFDMGWIRLFYWYGIIPACIFIVVMILVMFYCYKKKQYFAIVLITSFALYSVVEAHAISVYLARNYVFFLMGLYWSKLINRAEWLNEKQIATMKEGTIK